MKNIALFLGAGASVPFDFPTTVQFKEKLRNMPEKPIGLDQFLNNSAYNDIEHILRAIEDIEKFPTTLGGKFFQSPTTLTWPGSPGQMNIKQLLEILKIIVTIIKEQVYKLYSWDDSKNDKLLNMYDDIFSILSESKNKIHVFTTNYDQAIENYCDNNDKFRCNDGFGYDSNIRKSVFDKKCFDEDDQNGQIIVNLYKLHGSLNWQKHSSRMIRLDREDKNQDDSQNLVVYPTLSPKEGMTSQPFKSIRDKFAECIKHMDMIVVIGYSFRDEHINKMFKDFLKDEHKGIVVISPTAQKDFLENFLMGKENTYKTISEEINSLINPETRKSFLDAITKLHDARSALKLQSDDLRTSPSTIQETVNVHASSNQIKEPFSRSDGYTQICLLDCNMQQANQHHLFEIIPFL